MMDHPVEGARLGCFLGPWGGKWSAGKGRVEEAEEMYTRRWRDGGWKKSLQGVSVIISPFMKYHTTDHIDRMSHRIWREMKQHLI